MEIIPDEPHSLSQNFSNDNRDEPIGMAYVNRERFPIVNDSGSIRFRENRIIQDLMRAAEISGKCTLNNIWIMAQCGHYCEEELRQLCCLMGYSLETFRDFFGENSVDMG